MLYVLVVEASLTGAWARPRTINKPPRHPGAGGSGGMDVTENCPIDTNSHPSPQFWLMESVNLWIALVSPSVDETLKPVGAGTHLYSY